MIKRIKEEIGDVFEVNMFGLVPLKEGEVDDGTGPEAETSGWHVVAVVAIALLESDTEKERACGRELIRSMVNLFESNNSAEVPRELILDLLLLSYAAADEDPL